MGMEKQNDTKFVDGKTVVSRHDPLFSRSAWAVTALSCVWYLFLLTNGRFALFAPEPLGGIFDDMAWQMLHGRFTIDPAVVGLEAFPWHGQVYSYFGIFPALLRMPLVLLDGPTPPSLSRLSCWAGLCVTATAATALLLGARERLPEPATGNAGSAVALGATLLAAPLLSMTFTGWVYNEPIIWGTAVATCFLGRMLRMAAEGARPRDWLVLGALTGLAFITRPVPAIGMAIGMGLATVLWPRGWGVLRAMIWAGAGVVPLLAVALMVNYLRWGDATIFNPPTGNIQLLSDPRRMRIALERGIFELDRVPLGIGYYFFGVLNGAWATTLADRVSDGLGWPRSALAATATVPLVLFGIGAARYRRLPAFLQGRHGLAMAAMPVSMAAMMVSLIYMNYRYRQEFFPLLLLGSLAGATVVQGRRLALALGLLLGVNVAVSHLDLLQAKLASFAQPEAEQARIARATWPVSRLFIRGHE